MGWYFCGAGQVGVALCNLVAGLAMQSEDVSSPLLCMSKGAALLVGTIGETESHQHHAIQIAFGLREKFHIRILDSSIRTRSIIVASDAKHQSIGNFGAQVLLYIEPESDFGRMVDDKLTASCLILDWPESFFSSLRAMVRERTLGIKSLQNLMLNFWNEPELRPETDVRIAKALHFIEDSPQKKLRIAALAAHLTLSQSRLQHLFKQHVGISIKRYLLWKRLIDGINSVINGLDFSTAHYEAGFSDGAHMSRTFKAMFGINLSELFKSSRFIQVVQEYPG